MKVVYYETVERYISMCNHVFGADGEREKSLQNLAILRNKQEIVFKLYVVDGICEKNCG